jgi:hypothetical protein
MTADTVNPTVGQGKIFTGAGYAGKPHVFSIYMKGTVVKL